jgi:hypothetical protein
MYIKYKRWRIIFCIEEETGYILCLIDGSRNFEDVVYEKVLAKTILHMNRLKNLFASILIPQTKTT